MYVRTSASGHLPLNYILVFRAKLVICVKLVVLCITISIV